MAIISTFKSIISPMEPAISRTTMGRDSSFRTRTAAAIYASKDKNISIRKGTRINVLPRMQESPVNDETRIILQQKHQLQEMVHRIKEMMANKSRKGNHVEELVMIDAIQRLNLQYYFQNEISGALTRHYERCGTEEGYLDLHDTALRFRLLRQHGYNVSADCFIKFKDKDGKFKQEIGKDIKGLMSLFEASHMCTPRDRILDDAGEFSGNLLRKMKNTESSKASIIENTLRNPCHKSLPRFTSLNFLQNFEISMKLLHNLSDESKWIKEMQYLAEIDINMAQINHQKEITQLSRWWKGLNLTEELKFARNRPTKWHMWSLACLPGPNMVEQRAELTKVISFVYLIDDIFDMYGTLEELTLFTGAVNRWEYDDVKGFPKYMSVCLKNLYQLISEISDKTYDNYGWHPENFLQTVWKDLFNAYLVEAKWFASEHTPSTDDYLKNGIVSCGVGIVCAYLFLLLGGGSNGSKDFLKRRPDIVSLAATILRLWNDLGGAKDENQTGHDASYVLCYINEHEDCSTESAREHVHTMISGAWKSINDACLFSSPSPTDFKEAVLNLARMVPVMYNYNNNHRLPSLEKYINSLQISEQTKVVS